MIIAFIIARVVIYIRAAKAKQKLQTVPVNV
jgi:hypothetical protein